MEKPKLTDDDISVPTVGQSEWFRGDLEPLEKKIEVVALTCPKCGKGEMVFTGMCWLTYPTGNHHKCTKCKYICAIQEHQYPEKRT